MKINFDIPKDNKTHRFCTSCGADDAKPIFEDGLKRYYCEVCGLVNDRNIYFSKKSKAWIDKNGELWHESVGVFVRNSDGKFLFFQRNAFPFIITIPAGHVDKNELPEKAASRELYEETSIRGQLTHLFGTKIKGDSCSGGADSHLWNLYLIDVKDSKVKINEEGNDPVWLNLEDVIKNQGIAKVIKVIITKYLNLQKQR